MSFDFHDSIAGGEIQDRLPGRYRDRVPADIRRDGIYTLVVFADDLVGDRTVAQALEQIDRTLTGTIVAVGRDFTRDARALLAARSAIVITRDGSARTEPSSVRT